MGIFERIGNSIGGFIGGVQSGISKALSFSVDAEWLQATGEANEAWSPDLGMMTSQQRLYAMLGWFQTAVKHVSNQAAGVPFNVALRTGEITEQIDNHEFEVLLREPNPSQSRFEFIKSVIAYYKITGNAYVWLNKASEFAEPTEMWIIPSNQIRPVPDKNLYIKGYIYEPGDGTQWPLENWEVMHWKEFNPNDRYIGLSAVEAMATVAIGDLAMQKWNTEYFNKNNAKMPGILTFADAISDPDWERLQNDLKKQQGGTKRNLMMMRNTGAKGVSWLATAMSQKDMEFLLARQFNKEEIFLQIGPGLASWLAVNATEASSKTGESSFFKLAVWPMLTALGQKITSDILPHWGENLVGLFDDVRKEDIQVKLEQQLAYERTHTVAETRMEWFGDEPLGDERDDKFPAQVKMPAFGANGGGGPNPFAANQDDEDDEEEDDEQNDEQNEAKSRERKQFKTFAERWLKEGKPERLGDFEFNVLTASEQTAVKMKYDQRLLIEAIDGLRERVE